MKKQTEKILEEYGKKADLYKKFTAAINFIFEDILKKGGYKYYVYSRLKDIKSLEEKIERKKLEGKIYKKLKDIKDVAGVRVIFFTEKDRRKFISKIQKEFKNCMKIEKTSKVSGYRATHATIFFGEERLKLSEYKAFEGLECEIQFCLILEHAWAEIEHDILYKENLKLRKLDKIHYLHIRERMQRIMRNYIHRASTELENIVLKFKKIKTENTTLAEAPRKRSVVDLKPEILIN